MALHGWCKHYRREVALGDGRCEADIDVIAENLSGDRTGMLKRMPCNAANDKPGAACCDKRAFLTPEEVAEEEERSVRLMTAALQVHVAAKQSPESAGSIPCPICNASVHFAKSPHNGHVHARCETDGCLVFME